MYYYIVPGTCGTVHILPSPTLFDPRYEREHFEISDTIEMHPDAPIECNPDRPSVTISKRKLIASPNDHRPAVPVWMHHDRPDAAPINDIIHFDDESNPLPVNGSVTLVNAIDGNRRRKIPSIMTFHDSRTRRVWTEIGNTTFDGYRPASDMRGEHATIVTPNNGMEGIFAIAEHLAEGQDVQQMRLDIPGPLYGMDLGQRLVPKTGGLTQLEKIIYNEAVLTAQGEPCLPHIDRKPRAWYLTAGGIRKHFDCTIADAEAIHTAWQTVGVTPDMAVQFDKWITKSGITAAVEYFTRIAAELINVTDEWHEKLDTTSYHDEDPEDIDDAPADDLEFSSAIRYHKLDDPRDNAPMWEERQPEAYQMELNKLRNMDMDHLTAWAQSNYGKPPARWNKTQMKVLWGAYKVRKIALTPPLRPFAQKVIDRMSEPGANLRKAAWWLYNEAPKSMNKTELSAAWNALKARTGDKKPAAQIPEPPPLDGYSEIESDEYTL